MILAMESWLKVKNDVFLMARYKVKVPFFGKFSLLIESKPWKKHAILWL